jgi:pimeloyl-ACP methyl ester carboxylesterase
MRVRSAGVALEVREASAWAQDKPSVVLVHGYPDQQDVWDRVVAALPQDALHLVTYDVRGAGASDAPRNQAGYRTELLLEDLAAVVAATVPEQRPVHLVGHDWGSVQLWDAVNAERGHPRLAGRIASFTSIGGPSLDRPPGRGRQAPGPMLRQLRASWYVAAFQVPLLPEAAWRLARRPPPLMLAPAGGSSAWGPELAVNAAHGLGLYRANIPHRLRHPGLLRTDVPVLVVRPLRDAFVTGVLYDGLDTACTDLRVAELDAGQRVMVSRPHELADLVLEHVRSTTA